MCSSDLTELRRDGMNCDRHWRLDASAQRGSTDAQDKKLTSDSVPTKSWVETCLTPMQGPVIAATDYIRAVPDLIRPWVPRQYVTLGTDGYGRSDTRAKLREYFEVDAQHIAYATLRALAVDNLIPNSQLAEAMSRLGIDGDKHHPWLG